MFFLIRGYSSPILIRVIRVTSEISLYKERECLELYLFFLIRV